MPAQGGSAQACLLLPAASCHCHCCGGRWEPPTTPSMDGRWLERDGAQALTKNGFKRGISSVLPAPPWHEESEGIGGWQSCQRLSDTSKEHPGAGLRIHRTLGWPLLSRASGVPAPQSQPLCLMRGLAQSGELPSQPPHCLPNGP